MLSVLWASQSITCVGCNIDLSLSLYLSIYLSHVDRISSFVSWALKSWAFRCLLKMRCVLKVEVSPKLMNVQTIWDQLKDSFIMFCSFAFFGFMPLLAFCVFPLIWPHLSHHQLFVIACVITGLTLFCLGSLKAKFGAAHWLRSGLEMLVLGGACATIAFVIGRLVGEMAS
jgi:VIT1/CCC1 family predicted Fe2+/Mn2+ transporter